MAETTQAVEEQTDQQQDQQTQAQSVELSQAPEDGPTGQGTSLDILMDMEVHVTVAIGKIEMPVQQLLQFGPGSVLKLDKSVDEPADLYLKGVKFATGHIVVVEDRFAVRINEIIGTEPPVTNN